MIATTMIMRNIILKALPDVRLISCCTSALLISFCLSFCLLRSISASCSSARRCCARSLSI